MSLRTILSILSFTSSAWANPINTQLAPRNATVKRSTVKYDVVIPTEEPLPFPVPTTFVTVAKYVNGTSTSTSTLDVSTPDWSNLDASTDANGWTYITTIIKGPSQPQVTGTSKEQHEDLENQLNTDKENDDEPSDDSSSGLDPGSSSDSGGDSDEDPEDGQRLQIRRDSLPNNIVGGDSDSEQELAFDIAPMPGYDLSPSSESDIEEDINDVIVVRDSMPPHIHDDKSSNSDSHWTQGPGPHWTHGDVLPRAKFEDDTPSDEHQSFDSEDPDSYAHQGDGSKDDPIIVTDTSDFGENEDVLYTS